MRAAHSARASSLEESTASAWVIRLGWADMPRHDRPQFRGGGMRRGASNPHAVALPVIRVPRDWLGGARSASSAPQRRGTARRAAVEADRVSPTRSIPSQSRERRVNPPEQGGHRFQQTKGRLAAALS